MFNLEKLFKDDKDQLKQLEMLYGQIGVLLMLKVKSLKTVIINADESVSNSKENRNK